MFFPLIFLNPASTAMVKSLEETSTEEEPKSSIEGTQRWEEPKSNEEQIQTNHPLKKHKVGEAQKNVLFFFLVFLNEQSNKEERECTFSNAFASWPAAMRLATSFLTILTKACFRFRIGPILAFMHFAACLLINPPKNHQSTPTRTTKNQESRTSYHLLENFPPNNPPNISPSPSYASLCSLPELCVDGKGKGNQWIKL